ncbi:MAG: hypothetical protein U1F68_10180 [Gammaproteobacteria bacterium]
MTGWQWFWTLVGFLVFIIILLFLYFYQPFELLFNIVLNDISFSNVIFWVALITGIIGFCLYHYHAYRIHIAQQHGIEAMVLSSLLGSTFTAILLCGGAALQAVQILCVYLLDEHYSLGVEFGKRLVAVVGLVILTTIFCILFWLLRAVRTEKTT